MRSKLIALTVVLFLSIMPGPQNRALADSMENAGASVVLAMDISNGMAGKPLRKAKEAARLFLERIDSNIPVAIVTFGSRAEIAQSYTTDRNLLTATIDSLKPSGGLALYDGGLTAVSLAASSPTPRRLVILLSHSGEYHRQSKAARKDTLALASANNILVYTVGLSLTADHQYLKELARGTNALNSEIQTADELVAVYGVLGSHFVGSQNDVVAADATTVNQVLSAANVPGSRADAPKNTVHASTSVVLAIDVSNGMGGKPLLKTKEAAHLFVERVDSSIPIAVVTFGSRAEVVQDYTTDKSVLSASIDSLRPSGGLALYDGGLTAVGLAASSPTPRRLVILLSHGGEYIKQSKASRKDTLALARTNNVSIFAIGLGAGAARPYLKELANSTYGLSYEVQTADELAAIYGSLGSQFTGTLTVSRAQSSTAIDPGVSSAPLVGNKNDTLNTPASGDSTDTPNVPLPADNSTSLNIPQTGNDIQLITPSTGKAPQPSDGSTSNPAGNSDNLSSTADKGLVPIVAAAAPAVVPSEGIIDILTRFISLILEPLGIALTTQHRTLATVFTLLMTALFVPQAVFTLYWMLYTWNNPEVAHKYRSPKLYSLPQKSFTAVLPARHEEDVIKATIKAIDRINYPDHLKEILVMIRDEDDDATIAKAQEAIDELGNTRIKLITFTAGPKNKPNGLNRGLRAASHEVVCVFDAEDEPHPDLYNIINTIMVRDGADVVQSGVQLMNFRSTWFSALNCLEYFFWFKSGLHCFTRAFNVTPLGGNTVFFKKHWLEWTDGWDEKCLTEDADVGIRLTALGAKVQIVYDEKHVTQEETPASVESFIKQRTRWCQGFYEVFFKGDWVKLPTLKQKLTALYILLNSLMQAGIILYLPVGLYIALTQRISVPIALISYVPEMLFLMQLAVNLIGIGEFATAYGEKLPFLFRVKMALVYYPYQLLLAVSAFRAVGRFVRKRNAWEKTAHANLHRQGLIVEQRA